MYVLQHRQREITHYSLVCSIAWPFIVDQPVNAIHLTDNLRIAYELVEVRTGEHATKPIYRTGYKPRGTVEAVRAEMENVLEMAFGPDGNEKRANVLKLREEVLKAWEPNGSSTKDFNRLLDAIHT